MFCKRTTISQFFLTLSFSGLMIWPMVAVLPALTGCSTAETSSTPTAESTFKAGEEFEKDERLEEAIAKFTEVKNKFPYSRLATQAELKIADINYNRESFIEAQTNYQLFKEFHPKHPQSDYVTFRLAMSYFNQLPSTVDRDLAVADKAITYFDEVIKNYGDSTHIKEAREKRASALSMLAEKELYIADFYLKREIFDSGLKRYEYMLKKFSGLGYDPRAHLGAAICALASGEREKAEAHYRELNQTFPQSDEAKRAKDELKKYGEI